MTALVFRPTGITPTSEQSAIQLLKHKRVLVEANAGAAKTTALALRVAQALERGAEPDRLLALTYTPAAVKALFNALDLIGIPKQHQKGLRVQTFDVFCSDRLQDIEGSGVPLLTTPEQLRARVLQATRTLLEDPNEAHPQALWSHISSEAVVESLLEAFAYLKGTLLLATHASHIRITPSSAMEHWGHDYNVLRAFQRCESQRHDSSAERAAYRTHGDATYDLALRLLDEDAVFDEPHPMALGLHLVVIDEMHDTNRAMFTVLQHVLQQNPRAAFVGVGDRDQVIHAVAGADAAFMGSAFAAEIGPAVQLPLTASYRFGPALAVAAGRVSNKVVTSCSTRSTEVEYLPCRHAADAAAHIARLARERAEMRPAMPASGLAVLLTQADQSVDLENHLLDQGVDYDTAGLLPYLLRPEILFVRGLLAHARGDFAGIDIAGSRAKILQALLDFTRSCIEGDGITNDNRSQRAHSEIERIAKQPLHAHAFIENQILRHAHPGLGRLAQAAVQAYQTHAADRPLHHFLHALSPRQVATQVLVRSQDVNQAVSNIESLLASATAFDQDADAFVRVMNERDLRRNGMRSRDRVLLASIEAVKGLEFDQVVMPCLQATDDEAVSHRNLFYVGMTRACQRLTILYDAARPDPRMQAARAGSP